jgi:hypothetical protein
MQVFDLKKKKREDVSDNWTKPHGGVGNLPIVFQIKHYII